MKKHTKSSSLEYSCPYFEIFKEQIHMPNGELVVHYIHHQKRPFVVILAISDNKILISRQWRPVIQEWNWEFPMGGMDEGESSVDAAKRELLEETGYVCQNCQEIGRFLVGVGHTNQIGILCLAQNVQKAKLQQLEPSELIEVNMINLADFEKMISQGTIIDGPTLASWQIYKLSTEYKSTKHKKGST